jgi:hypothetical protein
MRRPKAPLRIFVAWRLTGALELDALSVAVHQLMLRHEALTMAPRGVTNGFIHFVKCAPPNPSLIDIEILDREDDADCIARFIEECAAQCDADAPFRCFVGSLGERDHIVHLSASYMLVDGASLGIIQSDLECLYVGAMRSDADPAPAATAWRSVVWEHRELQSSSSFKHALSHWQQSVGDAQFDCRARIDRPVQGAELVVHRDLGAETSAAIGRLCSAKRATPFVVGLAALAVSQARRRGDSRLLIPVLTPSRGHEGLDSVVGFLQNILLLRVSVDVNASFSGLVDQIRLLVLEAQECDVPLYLMNSEIGCIERLLVDPDVLLTVYEFCYMAPYRPIQFGNCQISVVNQGFHPHSAFAMPVDGLMGLRLFGDRYRCVFEYDTGRFEDAEPTERLDDFAATLAACVGQPDVAFARMGLLPSDMGGCE